MFGGNVRDAERWRLQRAATAMNDVAIPGRSLMSMNACYNLYKTSFTCYVLDNNAKLCVSGTK